MSFLAPVFLVGLLALVVPLVLHFWRRRTSQTVVFPALRFLAPSRADQNRQKLRRRLVLALRCLALALLALAFARPYFGQPPAPASRATVLVVDPSFSLQTEKRWSNLQAWAEEALGSAQRHETLGILLATPTPRWLLPPSTRATSDQARRAVEKLRPGWESSRLEPALRLAADTLATSEARERRVLLLTDHQALAWQGTAFDRPLPPGVELLCPEPVAAPRHQAALQAASLRPDGEGWLLTVQIRNFGPSQARTLSVFTPQTSAARHQETLTLPEGTERSFELRLPALAGSALNTPPWLRLSLDADALPADDRLWVLTPATQAAKLPLLLDAQPNTGSRAAPGNALDFVATAFAALAELPPAFSVQTPPNATWPTPALAVLRNEASFVGQAAQALDAFLAQGGVALVFMDQGEAQAGWLARHGVKVRPLPTAAQVRDWNIDHALVAPLAADGLRALVGWNFSRAWALPAEACEPLAYWENGDSALGEFSVGAGRVLLVGWPASREASDWPVRPVFLPFLHRSATHLLGLATRNSERSARVGQPLPLPATALVNDETRPESGTWSLVDGPADAPGLSAGAVPAAPGIYRYQGPNHPPRLLAVGLAPEESDLSPANEERAWFTLQSSEAAPAPSYAARKQAHGRASESDHALWWWAFAGLGLFALAELGLANRTAR